MHACGHDTHMAILLATARVLTRGPGSAARARSSSSSSRPKKARPLAERPAGAELMVKEGVLDDPKVDAIFGLHVFANVPAGHITYRSGSFMAASDTFEIIVKGRQTHGSMPWRGVDPIVVGSQIVTALQTIVSRSVDITRAPAVVTVGQFQGGMRYNIIPDTARLVGTIRTFDEQVQTRHPRPHQAHRRRHRLGRWRDRGCQDRQEHAGHLEQPRSHGEDAADAATGRAGQGAASRS